METRSHDLSSSSSSWLAHQLSLAVDVRARLPPLRANSKKQTIRALATCCRRTTAMMRSLVFAAAALSATAFAPARPSTAVAPAAEPSLSTLVAAPRAAVVLMAVPKSRTSKKKTRQRKANWFAKANIQRERALTLGRSVLSEGEGSFIYNPDEEDDDEDDDEYEDDDEDDEDDEEDDEAQQGAASCVPGSCASGEQCLVVGPG